jgi:hypothetical protein
MKSKLLFFAAIFAAFGLNAQSVGFDYPVSLVEGTLSNLPTGELEADWGVINLSASPVSLKARRQIINEVVGSSNYFCWGVCYDAATTVSILAQTIAPGDTNHTFYAHYLPEGNAGVTTINYRFYVDGNMGDYAEQAVMFCVDADCTAGVEENNEGLHLKVIGAQPSSGMVTVQYALMNSNATFEVWNSNGQLMKRVGMKTKNGQVFLNANEFANGAYILRIVDGNASTSQRWVVQH